MSNEKSILVVEDEIVAQLDLVEALKHAGFNILVASDAFEALELLAHKSADIIISDHNMPGMNGMEFFEKLKDEQLLTNTPFIFVTGTCDPAFVSKVEEMGAYHVSKPWYEKKLLSVIKDARAPKV